MYFNNLKMPPANNILGWVYTLIIVICLVNFIYQGYWHGVTTSVIRVFKQNYKFLCLALVFLIIVINFLDLPVTKLAQHYYHAKFYRLMDLICSCAEGWFIGGLLMAIIIVAENFKKYQLAVLAKISIMAALYAGIFNGVFKFIFNRQRPGIGLANWHFFEFFIHGSKKYNTLLYAYNSMPSGHTITTVAAIIPFFLYSQNKLVKTFLVIWLLLVAFARIYTINHWLSDVLVSMILGGFIGYANYLLNKERINDKN